jgi:hypothetical protein
MRYRKFLFTLFVFLFGLQILPFTPNALSDDQVYSGDSRNDPQDESSDYSD